MTDVAGAGLTADRPFPGLRPFDFPDHDFFFGRDHEVYSLYRLVDRSRFIADAHRPHLTSKNLQVAAVFLVDGMAAGTWKVGPFHLPEPRHLGPLFIAWGASLVVLVGQKDMGSSLLFFALFVVLLWVATERVSWLAMGAVLFAAGSFVAWNVIA